MPDQKTFTATVYHVERYKTKTMSFNFGEGVFSIKSNARIICLDQSRLWLLYIMFLTPDSPPANNVAKIREKSGFGYLFIPSEDYPHFIDLFRNETPIYAYLNSKNPLKNKIKTSLEEVGEEET